MDTGPTLKEQQLAWAVAWQDHGDRAALAQLCDSVEKLVKSMAGRMARGRRERFEELVGEFRLAVVEAANDFDRNRPNGFAMLCGFYMQSRAFRVMQHAISPATLPYRDTTHGQRVAVFGDDESEEVVQLTAPEPYEQLDLTLVAEAFHDANLSERERRALERHLNDESLEEVGALWGVTPSRVGQIERVAREKVRSALQAKGLELEDLL